MPNPAYDYQIKQIYQLRLHTQLHKLVLRKGLPLLTFLPIDSPLSSFLELSSPPLILVFCPFPQSIVSITIGITVSVGRQTDREGKNEKEKEHTLEIILYVA